MSISYEEMATKLLNEKLLLTALELHAELCEAGKELPILREFFSNPNNFENSNIKPEPYTPMRMYLISLVKGRFGKQFFLRQYKYIYLICTSNIYKTKKEIKNWIHLKSFF